MLVNLIKEYVGILNLHFRIVMLKLTTANFVLLAKLISKKKLNSVNGHRNKFDLLCFGDFFMLFFPLQRNSLILMTYQDNKINGVQN